MTELEISALAKEWWCSHIWIWYFVLYSRCYQFVCNVGHALVISYLYFWVVSLHLDKMSCNGTSLWVILFVISRYSQDLCLLVVISEFNLFVIRYIPNSWYYIIYHLYMLAFYRLYTGKYICLKFLSLLSYFWCACLHHPCHIPLR